MTMTPADWRRVESIYHAALARPVTERTAFLVEACAGDDTVRREVDSLLAAGDRSDSLLKTAGAWPRTTRREGGGPSAHCGHLQRRVSGVTRAL